MPALSAMMRDMTVSGLAPTPLAVPVTIDAGTTVKYCRSLPQYPGPDWVYTLYLVGTIAFEKAVTAATDDPARRDVVLAADETATLNTAGTVAPYRFVERVSNATTGEAYDISTGTLQVNPNVAAMQPGDNLTQNQRILAALRSRLEGRITADCESYSIAGRSISRIPFNQLADMIARYEYMVWAEQNPSGRGTTTKAYFPPNGRDVLPPGLPPGGIIQ